MFPNQAEAALRQAGNHFQAGRLDDARALLVGLVSEGHSSPQALLMLAVACRELGDKEVCHSSLDQLLQIDPKIVRALLMKGDLAAEADDVAACLAFYKRALAEAEVQAQMPADLRTRLHQATIWIEAAEEAQRRRLEQGLIERGIDASSRSRRFQTSLDLLSGKKQLFLQQPGVYYFPGLPQIEFYEPEEFTWAAEFQQRTAAIRGELSALLEESGLFAPYLVSDGRRPPSGYHGMVDNPDWSSFYLWSGGHAVEEAVARCPATMSALEAVPLARMSVRAPVVMFSLLRAGARIPAHHGSTNTRLICHLPLIVPPHGCALRVGNDVQEWEEGKLLIFDDSIEHEAWNESQEDRVVLIFDIWRPELTGDERYAVQRLFETMDGE